MYALTFFMDTHSDAALEQGRMILTKEGKLLDVYIATTGAPRWQNRYNVDDKGKGPIPPCNDVGIPNYWVETKPIPMPNKKGIEGNFYPIKPFMIKIAGTDRGDFGIHPDGNVPGSAGCIVLPKDGPGWKDLEKEMSEIAQEGISRIPLVVVYS